MNEVIFHNKSFIFEDKSGIYKMILIDAGYTYATLLVLVKKVKKVKKYLFFGPMVDEEYWENITVKSDIAIKRKLYYTIDEVKYYADKALKLSSQYYGGTHVEKIKN